MIAAALLSMLVLAAPAPAHADDDPGTGPEVCGGFDLALSPSEIAQGLQRNDGRYNYWRAQHDSTWPIITGDCG